MLPGLYSEGGKLYIEVTAKVPASPYAWPAFWALAKDSVYPLEYDAMEVFGQPQTSYDATIHYLSPNVTGNNTVATRVLHEWRRSLGLLSRLRLPSGPKDPNVISLFRPPLCRLDACKD